VLSVKPATDALLAFAGLRRANLSGAVLMETHLPGAVLFEANLSGASLILADLSGAVLEGADLSGAVLDGVDLRKADGLTQAQLDTARGDASTRLPDGLRRPASWEAEETSTASSP
jgi:uncharacterized protein YjbI with pentapeptide repeats